MDYVLVASHNEDGSWLVYGPGPVGVHVSSDVMVTWCEAILARATGRWLTVLPIADPDEPRFNDQDRDVGDGTDMPRVTVDPPVVVARALLCVIAGLLGLILGILTAVVFAWSIISGAAVGAVAGAVVAGAIAVTTFRGRAR